MGGRVANNRLKHPGQRALLKGLETATHLNGLEVRLVRLDEQKNRWVCWVPDKSGDGCYKNVRVANLDMLPLKQPARNYSNPGSKSRACASLSKKRKSKPAELAAASEKEAKVDAASSVSDEKETRVSDLDKVLRALQSNTSGVQYGVPPETCAMLATAAPGALQGKKEWRHKSQEAFLEAIGRALHQKAAALHSVVITSNSKEGSVSTRQHVVNLQRNLQELQQAIFLFNLLRDCGRP